MMAEPLPIRPDVRAHLDAVETFAQRKFLYRTELETLLELNVRYAMGPAFDDLIFYAKFATQAAILLEREGAGTEETEKLSKEFAASLETVSQRLRSLLGHAPADVREQFEQRFLALTPQSFGALLALANELSWIKNYAIDSHRRIS